MMKTNASKYFIFILKAIALLAFIYFTNKGFGDRLSFLLDQKNYSTLVVFIALWCLSIFILLAVSFQKKTLYRVFWGFVISATTAISYGFYAAGGSELELLDFFELWQARHEAGRAIGYYMNPAIQAGIIALIGFLIIAYPPPKIKNQSSKLFNLIACLPLLPVFLFSSLIFLKSDRALAGLPQQFTPVSMAIAIATKSAMHEIPQRQVVKSAPVNKAKTKHLLYLVDESINPDYIYSSLGHYYKGFSDNKDKIADFGIAVSGSNCSASSNAILRLGATPDKLIQSVKTNPTLWQYAKKAGFRTVYIDAQATGIISLKPNDFQNYMTIEEAKFIDSFHKIKNVPSSQLDFELLELVKKELANDIPTFIYANKNGAHFPYNANYPKSEAIYQPVVSNSNAKGLTGLQNLYKQNKGLQAVINTYKNSIHWTVDMFFRKFFNEIDLDDTVVIYTSDHGQYFNQGSTTHCTAGEGSAVEEGLVPLMLMTGNNSLFSEFTEAAKINFNKADHFSLFPTVLNLLGYSNETVENYGATLFEPPKNTMAAFNTGDILGIISSNTNWREVSREERTAHALNTSIEPSASLNEMVK